uniref:Uncharacterized protein n=1 Tax=Moniliophthora roreri TaxID=221103 RepID=A0A0W0FJI9_MONRR
MIQNCLSVNMFVTKASTPTRTRIDS